MGAVSDNRFGSASLPTLCTFKPPVPTDAQTPFLGIPMRGTRLPLRASPLKESAL